MKNSLRSKRSVDSSTKINKIPEDPMQDLSQYIKKKPGIHYIKNQDEATRLESALETIHSKKLLTINKIKKLNKILRNKRAVPIEHVRETIKTNTDIHYDIPKEFSDKLKAAIHNIPLAISHLPLDHGHHGHLEHLEHLEHLGHLNHHGPHHGPHHGHEHVIKDIKTDFHYDNIHKENPGEKIKAAIHHLHVKKVKIQKKIENLRKIFVTKRSVDNLRTERFDSLTDGLRTKHFFEPSVGKIQEYA